MDDFSTIVERMKTNFKSIAGYSPSDVSDTGIRLHTYATEILECMLYAKWLEKQVFVQTATGENLDRHALEYGITRLKGSKASGTVKFSIPEAIRNDVVIPTKTELKNEYGVSYITDAMAVIEAGETEVTVNITAKDEGTSGNAGVGDIRTIGKNFIQVIGVADKNIVSVVNEGAVVGGADIENDEQLRKRIIAVAQFPSTGSNATYYRNIALTVDGVRSASFAADADYKSIVHMFLGGDGGTVTNTVANNVKAILDRFGQVGLIFLVHPAIEVPIDVNIFVSAKLGFNIIDVKLKCNEAIKKYLGACGVGEQVTKASISEALYSVEGVKEISFDTSCEIPKITENQLVTIGNITVQAM